MKKFINHHFSYWNEKKFTISVLGGFLLLFVSLLINNYANIFAYNSMSNPVTDIILDNIPLLNVGPIVVWGAIGLIVFITVLLIVRPQRIPFVVKSVALFVLIRAVFISLTHIAPFPGQLHIAGDWFSNMLNINESADLFFSGHTGLPFLMALAFWDNKPLRIVFLISTVVLGAAVLFGHLHYSIDVFAAFFITYAIFDLSKYLFTYDYHVFMRGLHSNGAH